MESYASIPCYDTHNQELYLRTASSEEVFAKATACQHRETVIFEVILF